MPSIKEYNVKLKSLKSTQKITKTMKMVSASKLRRAQDAQASAKMYAKKITETLSRISTNIDSSLHPLLRSQGQKTSRALILIYTSDKGLCGAFNHNANRQVRNWLLENENRYEKIELSFCGKRGRQFFRRHPHIRMHYDDVTINPDFATAVNIGREIIAAYLDGEIHELYLAYNQFFSPLSQKTVFEKVLPIDPEALRVAPKASGSKKEREYLFEPEASQLLEFLIPHFLYFKIFFALLENSAGEHGSRMSAMDSATKNAGEMIDHYTLLRNRARQAQITTELTEIVAGAEALN